MQLNFYQGRAAEFAAFPDKASILYPLLALGEEVGELQGKFAKMIRKDGTGERSAGLGSSVYYLSYDEMEGVVSEAGDILWNLAVFLKSMELTLEEVAEYNLNKLQGRQARNTIVGEGDNR
jgi:NTP pyrophosphatase (non-canonical NTP hydrolase)